MPQPFSCMYNVNILKIPFRNRSCNEHFRKVISLRRLRRIRLCFSLRIWGKSSRENPSVQVLTCG